MLIQLFYVFENLQEGNFQILHRFLTKCYLKATQKLKQFGRDIHFFEETDMKILLLVIISNVCLVTLSEGQY